MLGGMGLPRPECALLAAPDLSTKIEITVRGHALRAFRGRVPRRLHPLIHRTEGQMTALGIEILVLMAREIAVTATIALVLPTQDGRPDVATNLPTRMIFPTRHLRELTRDDHHQGGGLARKRMKRIAIIRKTIMSRLPIASLNGGGTALSGGGTILSGSGTVLRPNPYRDFLMSVHLPLLLLAPLGLPRLLSLVHDHVNLVRMTNLNLTSRCLFKLPTFIPEIYSMLQTHFFPFIV